MKKFTSFLLAAVLLLSAAGCGKASQTEVQPSGSVPAGTASATVTATPDASPAAQLPITVKDSRGVEVTFEKIPEKVVSLMPSDTEILYALKSGEKIIAVSNYCNYPSDTANKKKLPTGEQLDVEALIGLNPDVVFIGKMSAVDDQVKQLEDAGVKVIVTEANSLSETYQVIGLVGTVMGKDQDAASVVDSMKKGFDQIREEVRGKTPKTVYVEVSPLQFGLYTCGKDTFVQELIDIIGARNIFDDMEGWPSVSEEQVLKRNPDIILTTSSPLTGIADPVGEIKSRANWSSIAAVKNGKVVMLDGDMISRPGPRLLDAAKELVKAVYSE